jgi:GrpB-like predicted nucleotidyltransferase (UPF0157 family)/GNAT superfamily N-acetyltransferase
VPDAHLEGLSVERNGAKWAASLADPGVEAWFVLVAEEGGRIVGFAKSSAERSGDPLYRGEIHALYVLPEYQGRGIGRRLMTESAHGLLRRGFGSVLVWVLKENEPSTRFYERLGGQPVREQSITIAGKDLIEVAYAWPDLAATFAKPPRGPVIVTDYDPAWLQSFETIRSRLGETLKDLAIRIEHVGSTSVPGLAAKPILDIDVLLRSASDLPEAIRRLTAIDYEHEGDKRIPTRHAFRAHFEGPVHHLYVCTSPEGEFRRHVALRDFLRSHPTDAAAYAQLKHDLARRHPDDINAYMAGKDAFVRELLVRAMQSRCQ